MKKSILAILVAGLMVATVFAASSVNAGFSFESEQAVPPVSSGGSGSGGNGLPDLTIKCGVWKDPEDGSYWCSVKITNVGDAGTGYWCAETNIYGPIPYILYKLGIINIPSVGGFTTSYHGGDFGNEFEPGAVSLWYYGPLPPRDKLFPGEKLVIIIESVVDPEKKVDESNEGNNFDRYIWWLPMTDEAFLSQQVTAVSQSNTEAVIINTNPTNSGHQTSGSVSVSVSVLTASFSALEPFTINFGDGSSGYGASVSHTYPSAGTYHWTATSNSGSDSGWVTVGSSGSSSSTSSYTQSGQPSGSIGGSSNS